MASPAAASEGSLALFAAGGGTTQTFTELGPCLTVGMGEAATVAALNAWGAARDGELVALKADLSATQVGVSTAFEQA